MSGSGTEAGPHLWALNPEHMGDGGEFSLRRGSFPGRRKGKHLVETGCWEGGCSLGSGGSEGAGGVWTESQVCAGWASAEAPLSTKP